MSRIDEALRQMKGGNAGTVSAGDQLQFRPAWPVSNGEVSPEVREERVTEPSQPSGPSRFAKKTPGTMAFSSAWRSRLALAPEGNHTLIEQFSRLATTLHQAQRANGLRSVMVTSAVPGDGKTLTAVNLALVLSESYHSRVLLIDADLRRPSIPSVVSNADGAGLSEALRSPTERKLALVAITPQLTLLPAGQAVTNSIEALTSPRMRQIIDEATTRFDWVVIDAPPIGPAADARLLTEMVGGTLFVVRAGKTQNSDVRKAIDALGREQILGVILNGVETLPMDGYYGVPRNDEKS